VADGPLHLAGGGVEALSDARVQLLGDPVDEVRVVVDQADALPEVVEAILSRRNYTFWGDFCKIFLFRPQKSVEKPDFTLRFCIHVAITYENEKGNLLCYRLPKRYKNRPFR